jgi:hypothetical protein
MSRRSKLSFWALAFLCLFPPLLYARNVSGIVGDTFEETSGSGLHILTKPQAATVFIDGFERGQTPYNNSALRAGVYEIRLVKEGYKERRFSVTLSGNSRMTVSIEMEAALGQVRVNISRPLDDRMDFPLKLLVGAEVVESAWVWGSYAILDLPVGYRKISVRAFGWREVSEMVDVQEHFPVTLNITLKPAIFELKGVAVSRKRFNPNNPGALGMTEFHFEVSAPGGGHLSIQDQTGVEVYAALLGPFADWAQRASWNGRNAFGEPLPEGRYKAVITGSPLPNESEKEPQQLSFETQIDYSLAIFPLALSGGIPGLLFVPVPSVLPTGSFQIEATLLFGGFLAQDIPPEEGLPVQVGLPVQAGLPFETGMRFSPLDRLELAAAFNATPGFKDDSGYGFSASAKYALFHSGNIFPLGFAAALSYTWASSGSAAPLGSGSGAVLHFPLSLGMGSFTALFSPGMRLPGMNDSVPRLLLSAGLLLQGEWFAVGISLRPEFDFDNTGSRAGIPFSERVRIMSGAEVKFYPPPSNLVYTLLGGACVRGSQASGFGGIGIALLY